MLLVLLALNWAVAFATRNSVPRRVMALARQSTGAVVMALGNSLIGAGFDAEAFDKGMGLSQERRSVNLSRRFDSCGAAPTHALRASAWNAAETVSVRIL